MARRPSSSADPDDDDEDIDDAEEDEEGPRRPRKGSATRARPHPKGRPHPVRRWKGPEGEEKLDADEEEPPSKHPNYWRARDSLYFEPLVALAIIVLLIVGMYAYTQNWPPLYVVESDSMQHGSDDVLGLINTGDLVLAQKVPISSIATYADGISSGYSTYGEYGDVILYLPNGADVTPVIHRAIVFLTYNPDGTYNVSGLSGLPCGTATNRVYATTFTRNDCATTDLSTTLELFNIGWRHVNLSIPLSSGALGAHSGFLTMGDNNFGCSPAGTNTGCPDQQGGLSQLVDPGWIVGVARGMIPWFGAFKLFLEGNAAMVPSQSWEWLGLTLASVILLAFGIHYALRAEGIEDPRRRAAEEEAYALTDEAEDERPHRAARFLRALQPWRRSEEDDEVEEVDRTPRKSGATSPSRPTGRRGRPSPKVRRQDKPKHPRRKDDDDL
jgi:signal peptidase I